MPDKITYLVLDYSRPVESRLCLESLKKYSKFDYSVIFLCNGGENQKYAIDLYNEGLIDKLILRKNNSGCGNSTVELSESCETKYFIYVQSDQKLACTIDQFLIDDLIKYMESNGLGYVDLSGAQAGIGNFTERAGLFHAEFYKRIPKGEKGKYGGPGPFNDKRYTESFIQEFFKTNNIKINHLHFFSDNGKWSIREMGDGLYKHSCDEKRLWILKKPTYKTEYYPPFNDKEWEKVLSGEWVDGDIPEEWKNNSFKCWE